MASSNLYPWTQDLIDEENLGFMKIQFILLVDEWNYSNFVQFFKSSDSLYHMERQIKKNHAFTEQICFYQDIEKKNKIESFDTKLSQIFKSNGRNDRNSAPEFKIYYDFQPKSKCALLLF